MRDGSGSSRALPAAEWAVQRRLDDLIGKLEPKFGDLRGRVEVIPRPGVTFAMIGGADSAKAAISGLSHALRMPDLYRRWGISPPRGGLLYGPPGNGKTLLAKALATLSEALFYHLRLATLTSKVGPLAAEVIKEVFQLAGSEGKGVIFFEDAEALSFEHILPPERAREAAAPLLIGICELLDSLRAFPSLLVVASTSRPDGIGSLLITPGRLDHLIEVPLPDGPALREIVDIQCKRAESLAERTLFEPIDTEALVPRLAGMSGGEVAEVVHRALEEKVHRSGGGPEAGLVGTADLLTAVDESRRVRDVVVKIRYGQYLSDAAARRVVAPRLETTMVFETTLRVRYAETDTMGVVYYGNYLTYFEVGRVEFLRQHGLPMSAVDRKVHMPVVEASVRYVKPARLDDLLRVRCWISERKRASFVFVYEIRHAETGEPIATGETRHACWNPETQRMIAIPDWLEPLLAPEPASAS